MRQASLIPLILFSTSPALAAPTEEFLEMDRQETRALNRKADADTSRRDRTMHRGQSDANADYQAARRRYQQQMDRWRDQVDRCRDGDYRACDTR